MYALVYSPQTVVDFEYVFLGIAPNKLYFIMHFNVVALGAVILAADPRRFVLRDFSVVVYLGGVYLLFVYVFKSVFAVE